MKILTTNIGDKTKILWKGKMVTTGIYKRPTTEPIFLDAEDVKGDTLCDRENHGGIDQAVYGYSFKHYEYWKALYPDLEWTVGGMFGENLTIDDLDESKIHVGDQFKIGDEVIIEATKSRQPCMKLGVRFNNMKIVKQFWNTNMPGVYFKVVQKGNVKAGDRLEQIKSCPYNITIAQEYEQRQQKNKKA